MRYGVSRKARKGIALAVSIALVFCTVPAVPAYAAETIEKIIKQVNFGEVNTSTGGTSNVILSISPGFNKPKNIAEGKVGNEELPNATSWIRATENSADSMEAKVKDNKIILTEGYGNRQDYNSSQDYNIMAEHKKASSVLNNATDVASIISTKDDTEILYYGNLDKDASINLEYSSFKIPAGLENGSYNMYIFAEDNSNISVKTLYTSKLGDPVEIEVLSSLKLDITGLDEPEAGKEPDTQAVLKIEKNNTTEEKNIDITWKDEMGNEVEDEFDYNRYYYAYASLEGYIEGYIADTTSVKINGEEAVFYKEENVISSQPGRYQTEQLDEINISGAVGSDNTVTLKAYTGATPPATPNPEYTYEWTNDLETSGPSGESHVVTQNDLDSKKIKVKLNTASQDNAAFTELEIKNGFIGTSIIEGTSKTDESVKGKSDGIIEGLTTDMAYSLNGGISYEPCTASRIEGLAAGITCRIKIERTNLVPAGLYAIYADYVIGEGRPLTVSFDTDGGNGVNAIEGVSYNKTIEEPANPVKSGYTFDGWYKDIISNDKWDFSEDKVTQDITLIAKWIKDQTANPDEATPEPDSKNTPEPGTTPEPDNKNTQAPDTTPEPDNKNTQAPDTTPEPDNKNTQAPDNTTPEPDNKNTPVPDNTEIPDGTTRPVQTAAPETTKRPPVNNNVVSPYIPPVTQQTQTTAPEKTVEPAQTQEPVQTEAPSGQPSQKPETETTKAPAAPSGQPSQEPASGNNTGEDNNNTTPDNTSGTVNDMPEGGKTVAGGAEYTSTGDGNVTLSSVVAGNDKKKIVIPDTVKVNGKEYKVTKIEKGAFNGSKVKTVELGSNIKTIGDQAFKGCKNLTTVKLNIGVKNIGNGAFRNCKKIKSIKLPNTVTRIGNKAFKNCKSMKTFKLGTEKAAKVNKSNKKFALRFGTNVAKVTIGASALENCVDLRSVVINSEVTKIGNSTFKYCSQLRKMLVKSLKLQKVGNQALKGVSNCKITVPPVKLKPYTTLFKNKGQGKKVVVAKS